MEMTRNNSSLILFMIPLLFKYIYIRNMFYSIIYIKINDKNKVKIKK